jgi:tRNA(Leu) C34 or U34 (ribose-2'-O)-methylase TrmL
MSEPAMRGFFAVGAEGISKPMNLGALVRTAHAFGASFVFLVDAYYRVRDSLSDTSRAEQQLPIYDYPSVDALVLPRGCQLVGIEIVEDSIPLPSFRHPLNAAYVLGAERGSLSPAMAERCAHIVRIPTRFCVNLAVAGAIVLYDRLLCHGRFRRARCAAAARPRTCPCTCTEHPSSVRPRRMSGPPEFRRFERRATRAKIAIENFPIVIAETMGAGGKTSIIAAAALVILGTAVPAAAEMVGSFQDWTLYVHEDDAGKLCYVASLPTRQSGNYTSRGQAAAFVSRLPTRPPREEVSVQPGYNYKSGSEVQVVVDDSRKFTMFTQGEHAWAHEGEDPTLIDAMRRGLEMTVRGTSTRDTFSLDTYSLRGFTAAYNAMQEACPDGAATAGG